MELTYQLNKNVNRVLCLDNVSAVQSGAKIDISNALCCMLIVEGTFEGKIIPILYANDMNLTRVYPSCRDSKGNYVDAIRQAGVYYVNGIEGFSECMPRLDSYTSGSVTVVGVAITDGMTTPRDRNVILARVKQTIEAGASYNEIGAMLTAYPFHYITIYADSAHQFEVTADYTANGSVYGYGVKDVPIFSSNGKQRGCSEWQEARGERIVPRIINNDSTAYTYELIVYGVR